MTAIFVWTLGDAVGVIFWSLFVLFFLVCTICKLKEDRDWKKLEEKRKK